MLWAWYREWNGKLRLACVSARQSVIHLQRFMQMYWTCWWSNSHKWLPLWKALSIEELETLPVGTKPRTSQHWLPGGERRGKSKHSTICWKDEKRLSSSRHWGAWDISIEELETLSVGTKPRTSQHWLPGGERRGKSKHSTICWKDEKRLSSSRQTLELFQRQCWGNLLQREWNAQGLCQAYSTIVNWTELNCRDVTQLWDIEGWSLGPRINFMVLDLSLAPHWAGKLKKAQTVLTAINTNSSYSYKWNSLA